MNPELIPGLSSNGSAEVRPFSFSTPPCPAASLPPADSFSFGPQPLPFSQFCQPLPDPAMPSLPAEPLLPPERHARVAVAHAKCVLSYAAVWAATGGTVAASLEGSTPEVMLVGAGVGAVVGGVYRFLATEPMGDGVLLRRVLGDAFCMAVALGGLSALVSWGEPDAALMARKRYAALGGAFLGGSLGALWGWRADGNDGSTRRPASGEPLV